MSARAIVSGILMSPRYKFYQELFKQQHPSAVVGSYEHKISKGEAPSLKMIAQPSKGRLRLSNSKGDIIKREFRDLITSSNQPKEIFFTVLDATFGMGALARTLLSSSRRLLRVLAMDIDDSLADPFAMHLKNLYRSRFTFMQGAVSECRSLFGENTFDGILLDLNGPCKAQLLDERRGFDLNSEFDGPCTLSYRVDSNDKPTKNRETLGKFLNSAQYEDLMNVFADRGELPYRDSNKIANLILSRRPIVGVSKVSTLFKRIFGEDLVDECSGLHSSLKNENLWHKSKSYRAITALRERLNHDREEFAVFLRHIPHILKPLGRCAIRCSKKWQVKLLKEFEEKDPKLYCPVYPTDQVWIFQKHTKLAYPLKLNTMLGSIPKERLSEEKDIDRMLRQPGIAFDPEKYPV